MVTGEQGHPSVCVLSLTGRCEPDEQGVLLSEVAVDEQGVHLNETTPYSASHVC